MTPADRFAVAQVRSSVPGAPILSAWRDKHGPEATRVTTVRAENEIISDLTAEELGRRLGALATSYAGKVVTEQTARQITAVYACVDLIAGAVASLPCTVYERTPTGSQPIDHDYWWLLNEQPYPELSSATFWEYLLESSLYHGDMFAQILRPRLSSSRISGFMPKHPLRTLPFRNSPGELLYQINPDIRFDPINVAPYIVDPADMLHVPGPGFNGLRSVSPITWAARQAIGTAMAAEEFSGRFFSSGARPDVVLKAAGKLDGDQVDILRSTWTSRYGGSQNASAGPVVLSNGLTMEQLSLSAEDSQLVATRQFQIEEIARIFGVPPHMIGHVDKTTSWGAGVESQGRGFVKFSLRRRLNKIEQELNRKLWPTRSRYFIKFDVTDLERGDLKSENEALRIALGRAGEPGWMTQDEVRQKKNLPPKGGAAAELGLGVRESQALPPPAQDDAATPA